MDFTSLFNSLLCNVELNSNLLIAYAAIHIMALIPIYVGARVSLNQKKMESMSKEDAWKFPFMGSAVLFGLYLLFKIFSKDLINLLLTSYFLLFGVLAVTATLKPLFEPFIPKPLKEWDYSINIPFFTTPADPLKIKFDQADLVSFVFSSLVGLWYATTKHWISNNILGFAFSIQGIALLSIGSYKIGCTLLSGLFIYDIFWVFGTDVMVTVAKSFDAPVKLLFPKDLFAAELQFSMLGLGDIVIPGIFLALLLRFDVKRNGSKNGNNVYFWVTFLGYIVGLVATVVVMHTFQAAQPALLYLVPACIGFSFVTAVYRGETESLLAYTEEHHNEKKE